jgi:hypothetical protein
LIAPPTRYPNGAWVITTFLSVTTVNSLNYQLVMQEIIKRELMFELGCVLMRFYEICPSLRALYMKEMDYLFAATRPYIKTPELTFKLSYGNTLAWNLIIDSLKLSEAFEGARRFDIEAESQISSLFDRIPNPKYSDPAFWCNVKSIGASTTVQDHMPQASPTHS